VTDSRIAEIREHFQGDDRNVIEELIAHICWQQDKIERQRRTVKLVLDWYYELREKKNG
jgi:uncharacterized coiled-coil protein SlyX